MHSRSWLMFRGLGTRFAVLSRLVGREIFLSKDSLHAAPKKPLRACCSMPACLREPKYIPVLFPI